MNSFNHYAYGAVAEWLYRYAAGIDADDPGFHTIVLHPQFNADLGELEATYESAYGPIGSHWKVAGGTVTWSVTIPPNTTAMLHFPAGTNRTQITESGKSLDGTRVKFVGDEPTGPVFQAGSGTYAFQVDH